jgi:hypothetical protein
MKIASRVLALTTFVVTLAVHAQPTSVQALSEKGIKPVGHDQLSELIVGNTLRHSKLESVLKLDMWYREDGIRVYWTGGPGLGRRFEGWYQIKQGRRCELSGGGGEVCFTLYPAFRDQYFLCDQNGKCDWTLSVEKGNPLRIE